MESKKVSPRTTCKTCSKSFANKYSRKKHESTVCKGSICKSSSPEKEKSPDKNIYDVPTGPLENIMSKLSIQDRANMNMASKALKEDIEKLPEWYEVVYTGLKEFVTSSAMYWSTIRFLCDLPPDADTSYLFQEPFKKPKGQIESLSLTLEYNEDSGDPDNMLEVSLICIMKDKKKNDIWKQPPDNAHIINRFISFYHYYNTYEIDDYKNSSRMTAMEAIIRALNGMARIKKPIIVYGFPGHRISEPDKWREVFTGYVKGALEAMGVDQIRMSYDWNGRNGFNKKFPIIKPSTIGTLEIDLDGWGYSAVYFIESLAESGFELDKSANQDLAKKIKSIIDIFTIRKISYSDRQEMLEKNSENFPFILQYNIYNDQAEIVIISNMKKNSNRSIIWRGNSNTFEVFIKHIANHFGLYFYTPQTGRLSIKFDRSFQEELEEYFDTIVNTKWSKHIPSLYYISKPVSGKSGGSRKK